MATDYRNLPYLRVRMKPLWSIVLLLLAVVAGSRADPTTTTTGPTTLATTTEAPESAQDPLKGSCALYCFITPEKVYGRGKSIFNKNELDHYYLRRFVAAEVIQNCAQKTKQKLIRIFFWDIN